MKRSWSLALPVLFHLVCGRHRVGRRLAIWSVALSWALGLGAWSFRACAADQPQWGRAWSRNMVSGEKGLPDSFDPKTGRNIKWVARLGTETHSTPIAAGGQLYVGTNNGEPRDPKHQGDRGVLMCFEEKTGKFQWQLVWLFDLASGAGIWPHDGAHSSILIHGDYLYLNTATGVDNTHKRIRAPDAPSLVVLDKKTGRLVARDYEHIAPDIFHCTWSSPSLGQVNGWPLIFFAGGNGVIYAFEELSHPSPGLRQPSPLAEGRGQGEGSALASANASAASGVRMLKKVWQFDFDPTAPKGDIHQYLSNRREGPSNVYGMP